VKQFLLLFCLYTMNRHRGVIIVISSVQHTVRVIVPDVFFLGGCVAALLAEGA